MCGVAGIVARGTAAPERGAVERMTAALAHRGPDGAGIWCAPRVALGHRRLSVIDPAGGAQPMARGDLRLVFNGEIFNFRALRADLARGGAAFRTDSDTEVVLAGYAREGVTFFRRLEGMFAGILYDGAADRAVAFRDAFGIKPLYRRDAGGFAAFASEIRALRADGGPFSFDRAGLYPYLACGYDPRGGTMLDGVTKVAPGTAVVFDLARGTEDTVVFDDRLDPRAIPVRTDLRRTLVDAFARATVSDVPVGLYLSGGVDSSLLAAILKREAGQSPRAFCVSFPRDGAFDEAAPARAVAAALGLEIDVIEVDPAGFDDLGALARTLEEPMLDPSAFALGALAAAVRPHVKVVLSGEGGDELFGGYHRYFWDGVANAYASMPRWLRGMDAALLAAIPGFGRRARKFMATHDLPRGERYFRWFSAFEPREIAAAARADPAGAARFAGFAEAAFSRARSLEGTAVPGWVDLTTFLREGLLVKADKMSMQSGVEVRVPYLQADIAAAGLRGPRVPAFATKARLRHLLRRYLPSSIVDRPKQGFEFPLDAWFRGPWRPWLDRYLADDAVAARGALPVETVRAIREAHAAGANRGRALYSLCMLEAWMREFVD